MKGKNNFFTPKECRYGHIPNKETLNAIKQAEAGKGHYKAKDINDLFKKCGIKMTIQGSFDFPAAA